MPRRLWIAIPILATALASFLALRRVGPASPSEPIRLADPTGHSGLVTQHFAVATLQDETRYVLDAPLRHLVKLFEVNVPPDGRVRSSAHLPLEFGNVSRIALNTHYRLGTVRTRLPLTFADVEPSAKGPVVHLESALPLELAGQQVGLHVEGFAVEMEAERRHQAPPVLVPARSYLAFAIGIAQLEPSAGTTEFIVDSCDSSECTELFREIVDPLDAHQRGWLDRRVPLDELGGETRSFVFRTRPAAVGDSTFSFPLWANPTIYPEPARAPNQLNVILLSIDTLGAAHLPSYGYGYDTAPFIQKTFGDGGSVFEHALAAATTTPQSHMSMLTGVQPCVHGVVTGMEATPDRIVTLAEVLRAKGYETGAVTEDGWLGYNHGFGRGFNVYAENKSADIMAPDGQIDVTFARAKRWLEVNRDKPFFLFLHTFQVHDPYSPPAQYQSLFTERDGRTVTADSPRPLREVVAYDQEIRYADDELERLFAEIQRLGLGENTIFILTSDHGEEFFEHGLWGHGPTFYEEVTRVPLMIWGAGHIPAGRRVPGLVGHIDIMPTVLDLLNVDVPKQVMGASLLPWLADGTEPPARVHYGEARVDLGIGPNYEMFRVTPPGFLAQSGLRKLARYRKEGGFEYRYYDLASDPGEERDLYPTDPGAAADLRVLVDDYEDLCARAVDRDKHGEQQPKVEMDPATEEKLRALGYLK